jgi:hypothetical protein
MICWDPYRRYSCAYSSESVCGLPNAKHGGLPYCRYFQPNGCLSNDAQKGPSNLACMIRTWPNGGGCIHARLRHIRSPVRGFPPGPSPWERRRPLLPHPEVVTTVNNPTSPFVSPEKKLRLDFDDKNDEVLIWVLQLNVETYSMYDSECNHYCLGAGRG